MRRQLSNTLSLIINNNARMQHTTNIGTSSSSHRIVHHRTLRPLSHDLDPPIPMHTSRAQHPCSTAGRGVTSAPSPPPGAIISDIHGCDPWARIQLALPILPGGSGHLAAVGIRTGLRGQRGHGDAIDARQLAGHRRELTIGLLHGGPQLPPVRLHGGRERLPWSGHSPWSLPPWSGHSPWSLPPWRA